MSTVLATLGVAEEDAACERCDGAGLLRDEPDVELAFEDDVEPRRESDLPAVDLACQSLLMSSFKEVRTPLTTSLANRTLLASDPRVSVGALTTVDSCWTAACPGPPSEVPSKRASAEQVAATHFSGTLTAPTMSSADVDTTVLRFAAAVPGGPATLLLVLGSSDRPLVLASYPFALRAVEEAGACADTLPGMPLHERSAIRRNGEEESSFVGSSSSNQHSWEASPAQTRRFTCGPPRLGFRKPGLNFVFGRGPGINHARSLLALKQGATMYYDLNIAWPQAHARPGDVKNKGSAGKKVGVGGGGLGIASTSATTLTDPLEPLSETQRDSIRAMTLDLADCEYHGPTDVELKKEGTLLTKNRLEHSVGYSTIAFNTVVPTRFDGTKHANPFQPHPSGLPRPPFPDLDPRCNKASDLKGKKPVNSSSHPQVVQLSRMTLVMNDESMGKHGHGLVGIACTLQADFSLLCSPLRHTELGTHECASVLRSSQCSSDVGGYLLHSVPLAQRAQTTIHRYHLHRPRRLSPPSVFSQEIHRRRCPEQWCRF